MTTATIDVAPERWIVPNDVQCRALAAHSLLAGVSSRISGRSRLSAQAAALRVGVSTRTLARGLAVLAGLGYVRTIERPAPGRPVLRQLTVPIAVRKAKAA